MQGKRLLDASANQGLWNKVDLLLHGISNRCARRAEETATRAAPRQRLVIPPLVCRASLSQSTTRATLHREQTSASSISHIGESLSTGICRVARAQKSELTDPNHARVSTVRSKPTGFHRRYCFSRRNPVLFTALNVKHAISRFTANTKLNAAEQTDARQLAHSARKSLSEAMIDGEICRPYAREFA